MVKGICKSTIIHNYQKLTKIMRKYVLLTIILASIAALVGCNVTRTVTTSSQYYQKGDTSCVIQTKTIESYDASKRL